MSDNDRRCAEAKTLQRIDAAFRSGDLEALRAAVGDPSLIPNGPLDASIGACLVYAIHVSPLSFIRTLLEIGADPNQPVADGFPPLIAALTCSRAVPGRAPRDDVNDVVRLLIEHGVDPNQRGINDYTALHMAVAERNALAVQILLEAGADQKLRTRIDDCDTPLEMARGAQLDVIAAILERKGGPIDQRLHAGVRLLLDVPGDGPPVRRQHNYDVRLRLWIDSPVRRTGSPSPSPRQTGGQAVRWHWPLGPADVARLDDDRRLLVTRMRMERRSIINGLFYGVEGMRVGGTRRLAIASHMAYGSRGVPGVIPPDAALIAEISVIAGV